VSGHPVSYIDISSMTPRSGVSNVVTGSFNTG